MSGQRGPRGASWAPLVGMDATGPPSPWAGALRGRPVRLCHPDAEHRMNLSVESVPIITPRLPSVRPPAPAEPPGPDASMAYPVREGVLAMPAVFPLEHGGELRDARLGWRLVGAAGAPVVCALGGISANREVCLASDPRNGWWSEIVGPGGALDTDEYQVLGFDYLGASGDSTGPEPGAAGPTAERGVFPSISSYDQAEALAQLLDHLGLASLAAIAGGSYGGMVGLAFAERYPERAAPGEGDGERTRPHSRHRQTSYAVPCMRTRIKHTNRTKVYDGS